MVIIGITGMISSGKTSISKMLSMYNNAVIFDADIEAKNIIQALEIDNKNIENNPMKLYKVEQEMLPTFINRLESFIKENHSKDFIILDIPLLYEFGLEKYCDKVINVYCNFDTRVKRIQSHPHISIEKFMLLNNKQMNDEDRNNKADYTINTEQSEEQILEQIKNIISEISG